MAIRNQHRLKTTRDQCPSSRLDQRHAFTLVELLVVLAILAAFAAMALPRLTRAFGRTQLQQSAQQLAEDISSARLFAIEHGITYEVVKDSTGEQYKVQPFRMSFDGGAIQSNPLIDDKQPQALTRDSRLQAVDQSINGQSTTAAPREPEIIEGELGPGIAFVNPLLGTEEGGLSIDTETELGGRLASAAQVVTDELDLSAEIGAWEGMAKFYSDGRANASSITLHSSDGYKVELTIRRLTGGVRVGPIQRQPFADEEELQDDDNRDESEAL